MVKQGDIVNYLSIDVEDYFQVSAFESVSPIASWDSRELRVERNTEKILNLLDEFQVKATFFVLGWVAERCPDLIKRIAAMGHEIASHGYHHQRVSNLKREVFGKDIRRTKELLENLSGQKVVGYRAPSYSITMQTNWAFDELLKAGYQYDSSIFPIKHDLYGISDWPRFPGYAIKENGHWIASNQQDSDVALREIPITTLSLGGRNLPIAGGGYFRLLPYNLTCWGLRTINVKERQPFVFYLHPWEFDPHQPRMRGCGLKSKIRHYLNLEKTEIRFRRLIQDFKFTSLENCLVCNGV
jgi:polysaccharide deacetylase family protein (PEP-CTERM system associated)